MIGAGGSRTVNRPKILGTARPRQYATHECACGCGQRPRNWKAQYVQGHRPPKPLAERLWARCVRMPNGCLEWTGHCHPERGYGQMGRGRAAEGLVETHRAAWEVTYGPIPKGMMVRHRCDNPPCCDPEHLLLGTGADNVADAVARNRVARGNRLPQTKLTDEQVLEIRKRYVSVGRGFQNGNLEQLAKEFGISKNYTWEVATGRYPGRLSHGQ